MKLTDVIAIWDELHVKDTGEIAYCDFEDAVEKVVGIENDVLGDCRKYREEVMITSEEFVIYTDENGEKIKILKSVQDLIDVGYAVILPNPKRQPNP